MSEQNRHPILAVLFGGSLMLGALSIATFIGSIAIVISAMEGNASFPVECGMVFGAAVKSGEYPGPGIERRVRTAVDLYHAKSIERFIFSGGKGEGNKLSEGEVMRKSALARGVPSAKMIIERKSTSTWENLRYSKPFLADCDSVVGISDSYHLSRIRFLAWLQGIKMTVHPADTKPNVIFEARSVLREALGNIFYGISSVQSLLK